MKLSDLRRKAKSPGGQKFPVKFVTGGQNSGQSVPLAAPVPPRSGAVGPTNVGGKVKGDPRKERFMGGEHGT